MIKPYLEQFKDKGEVYLRIKVLPNMPTTEIRQIMADGTIKINLSAKPEKGKANQELANFLAHLFDVSANNVKIIAGAADRLKFVKVKK